MSVTVPPARGQPEEPCTQTATVNSNKNQTWYQRLCRAEQQRAEQQRAEQQRAEQQRAFQQRAYQQEEPKDAFLSPQRLQLQLHFQREYRQRQELEKNCRQDWWQRNSGPGQVPLSPMNYRTPSPVRKFYQGDPIYYQNAPHSQPTPDSLPRRSGMQPSAKSYYRQPDTADAQSVSAECRRRIERDLIDREREKMIKAAQVIKHDAEKRIRQAKREMAATSNDQENIQRLLLQLLKEQDLAQKLQASNQIPPAPAPMSNLSVDLQYKLATLLQAYQAVPPQQQQSAGYQRKWQEQIGTYKDMLQEYRQGNFFQSHQKAKQLLQLLLLQKEPPSAQVPLPPRYYLPQQQQEPVYQQYPNHAGGANMQPYFRVPLPPQPIRSRRDPRLNRSSQQYYTRNDITPRLNQSSCQYSEQDITPEIIYQADISGKAGIVRRNSTPRKQPDEYPINKFNVMASTEGAQKPQSEQHVTHADDRDRNFRKPVETQTDDDLMLDRTPVARDGHESDSRSESKEYLQDWDQLQQRSRHLRRGRGYRRSPEERMGDGQKKPAKGAGKGEKTNVVNSSSKEHFSADQKHTGSTRGDNAHVVINGGYGKAFPDKEVEHPQSQLRSEVCSETILEPPENFHQQKMDHQAESESKRDIEAGVQNKTQRQLLDGDQANKIENGMSIITSETNGIGGIRKAPNNHSLPVKNEELPNEGPHDSQIRSGFHVRFSTSSQKDAVDFEMDDHNNRNVSDNNETVLQEKDHPVTKQRSSKDAKEPKDGAGQATHTMLRSKQQPSPQSRQNTQARGQTSRYSQPPQSQRAPKSQLPPRAARQSPAGSKQSPGNQHQMAGTRPPSQNSQLPDSQSAQSENRVSTTGMKSGHEPPENVAGKSEGTKPSGNAASRQGGKKSPGNTYVIRNSGQRFTPKAPSGAQREKARSAKPQGSSAHSSKNSSPKSAESNSPPEPAGKAQVSPSLKSRRRRYRRKPWEPDETDSYKMSRSSSAPQSQQRFQDRGHDHGHPSGWVSPSRRWMARSSNWESQPRRRPYQWEDSKTAPVRKRAYGQQGETVSSKVSPSEKKQKVSGNSQSPNVSAQDVKPDESSFTTQHELPSDRAQGAAEHTLGIRDRDKDDKEKDQSEQTNEDKAERNDHADKTLEKATQPVSAAVSPKSSETGETEEPTLTTHQEDIHEKEQTMESENEESERQNYTPDTKTLTAIEAGEREMPQTRSASPGNVSGALEEGCQTSEDSPGPQPDPAAGKERPEPGAFLLPKEETSAESHTAAKEAESKSYSFRLTRPDTLLEHVLAVLGQKAARGDEESDEDDEDGSYLEQLLHSTEQELQGNDESTKTVSELPAHNGPEAILEEAGASVPDGVTPVNTATGSSPTESVLAATSAKILRLEEMEDWQLLDIPSQEKDKADTISNLQEKANIISNSQDKADSISSSSGHEQGLFVRSDQSQELMIENQEAVKSPGDGSSAEDEHRVSPENQEGKLGGTPTQQLEKPVEGSENHDQTNQQARVDEHSGQSDKTEDQHGISEEVAESIPGQNDSGIASVEESICNNSFKEMQESSVMPEHETLEQLPENGEMQINDEGLLKPGEKQDELSTEDALEIDLPESGQAEKTSDGSVNSEGVPASESGPEAAGDKFCLLSGSENQVAPCFESCESADDRRKQSSCQLPQNEKPCLEDHCEDKSSSHGDDQSFHIAQADGCKEICQIENMDTYQSSETKELKSSMVEAQDSLSANVTDSEQMASIGKIVHADRTDEKQIPPADTFAVMDQPDVQSYEASCQSTVSPSDVDLCKQEKATVISPLSALARDAVVKFCGADSLPTKTEKTQLEDFTDRRKTVPSNQSPVLSPAKDNEESDTTVTDSNNHSPVLTSAKDNEESDTNVTDNNNQSPVLSPAKDNLESDTNVTDSNNHSPVLTSAKDNEEFDIVTDSNNHSPVLSPAKDNEESDNVTDSNNHSPVLTSAKDNEESDTNVTDSNNHSPVLTSAKDDEEFDTVTDSSNHSPVLSPAKDNEESDNVTDRSPAKDNEESDNVTDSNNHSPVLTSAKDNEESDNVTDSNNHSPVLTSAKDNEESDTNVTDSNNQSPVLSPAKDNGESDTNVTDSNNHSPVLTSAKDNEEFDKVTDSNPSHMNATSEGKTVTDENVQVLVESRLGNMVQDLTNSSKKKSVSFADLLQSSSGDKAEGDEETGKGPTTPGVRMRSPPAERSGFCCEEGLNETNRPQATEETCPKCDRPAASEKVKSGMAFGEILHDKLTAFGYL
ncbi:hypothetical protein ACOMHN_067547 [Nucella lapillus]